MYGCHHDDGFAFHQKSKRIAILEFTSAMDSSEDWETNKDAEKRARYAPVLDFFNSLPENQGWTLLQLNFTVWVRGSISNVDRCHDTTLRRHGLAQSPRLALLNSPLIGDERLEHRALRGGHRGERQPSLTGSAGRKKLKVERLRHGSARRTTDPFSTCHDTTLRCPTRRPSLPTPDATQRTFV